MATFLPDDDARLDPGSDFGKPDANGWMPIWSAPKDGRPVLLWHPSGAKPTNAIQVGFWYHGFGGWHSIPGTYGMNPTHWQPRPKSPVQP